MKLNCESNISSQKHLRFVRLHFLIDCFVVVITVKELKAEETVVHNMESNVNAQFF